MATTSACCQAVRKWMKANHGREVFAPFTGQDWCAFETFVHALELYMRSDDTGRRAALSAMRSAVLAMQTKTQPIAKWSIPFVLDWPDEERLWLRLFPSSAVAGVAPAETWHCVVDADRVVLESFSGATAANAYAAGLPYADPASVASVVTVTATERPRKGERLPGEQAIRVDRKEKGDESARGTTRRARNAVEESGRSLVSRANRHVRARRVVSSRAVEYVYRVDDSTPFADRVDPDVRAAWQAIDERIASLRSVVRDLYAADLPMKIPAIVLAAELRPGDLLIDGDAVLAVVSATTRGVAVVLRLEGVPGVVFRASHDPCLVYRTGEKKAS